MSTILIAVICWFMALTFGGMALWAYKRRTPMHFWSGSTVRPEEITDIPAYNRANGRMWLIYAAGMAASGVLSFIHIATGFILMTVLILPGIIVLIVVYKRIYNKYSTKNPLGQEKSSAAPAAHRTLAIIGAVLGVALCVWVVAMLIRGASEPTVNILSDGIQIRSMYGVTIPFSDIAGLSLIEDSMSQIGVSTRVNGYGGIGETLKGHFTSRATGATLLFVQAETAPTIRIERHSEKDVYISFKDGKKTEALYRQIIEAAP